MPEFINVPVPAERVQEVFELLARPPRSEASATPPVPPTVSRNGWSDAEVQRAYRESESAMRRVFDHLADHAGEVIRSEDLANAVNLRGTQLAGVFGAFGRRRLNRYGREEGPFDARWNPQEGMVVYRMSPETARAVVAARN